MILLFEEFKKKTLDRNISTYNDYYDSYADMGDRAGIVAWEAEESQEKNFNLVSKYIKNGDSVLDFGCGIGDLLSHLKKNNIMITDYMGVDINEKFINLAKKSYPENNFQLIQKVKDIKGKWDDVCAIGVFTWYIKKKEFIKTINRLYELSNKQVLLTCLYGDNYYQDGDYWENNYRYYNEDMFEELFPNFKFEFEFSPKGDTMLVRILK